MEHAEQQKQTPQKQKKINQKILIKRASEISEALFG